MKRARPTGENPADVRVSKAMSKLLRHQPPPGTMDAQGWVALPTLIQHLKGSVTEDMVRRIVDSNDKKRFVIDDSTKPARIRAAQGHSVQLEDPVLEEVTDASTVPCAVHVTSHTSWKAIRDSGQLQRMNRTHIHFATLPHHMRKNSWAQVLLRLNVEDAMKDGFKFVLSSNQVLLCEGPLPIKYVTEVKRADLPADWGVDAEGSSEGQDKKDSAEGQSSS